MAIDEASGLQVYGGLEQQDKQLHRTQSYSMDNSTQGMEDTVGKRHCDKRHCGQTTLWIDDTETDASFSLSIQRVAPLRTSFSERKVSFLQKERAFGQ